MNINSFAYWLKAVFNHYKGTDVQRMVMLCWAVWKCRNNLVWNQRGMEVAEVVVLANYSLNQWLSAQNKLFDTSLGYLTQVDGDERQKVPDENTIKINTDAAIFETSNCFSYSRVARNHASELVEAFSKCIQGSVNPEMEEAIGIREALSWTKKKKWNNVVVETDCLVVVQAIRSSTTLLSYFGRIIEECKYALEELKDRNVYLRFVRRSANNVAHYIARYSSLIAERIWRVDRAHSEFHNVLLKDLEVE